jgi:hypothetical protein
LLPANGAAVGAPVISPLLRASPCCMKLAPWQSEMKNVAKSLVLCHEEMVQEQCWEKAVDVGWYPLANELISISSKISSTNSDLNKYSEALQVAGNCILKACEVTGCIVTAEVTSEDFKAAGLAFTSIPSMKQPPITNEKEEDIFIIEYHKLGICFIEFAEQLSQGKLN